MAKKIKEPPQTLLDAAIQAAAELEAEVENDSEFDLLPDDGPTLLYRVWKDLEAAIEREQKKKR